MSGIADALVEAGMSEGAAQEKSAMFARAEAALRTQGVEPRHRFHVPGRIEVLGKHTDYAGGRSLLTAVERGFSAVSAPREDGVVRLIDVGREEEVTLAPDGSLEGRQARWAIYPAAVVRRLARDFAGPLEGADITFISDLPPASGLSSSSALVVATFQALRLANGFDEGEGADFRRALPGILDVAAYLGSVESGRPFSTFDGEAGVGVAGGSQDQTAILASEAGRVCQFGFAPVRAEGSVALPDDLTFVVGVSGVAAQKTAGAREAYNRAAAHSAAILEVWRLTTGRPDSTLFEAVESSEDAVERVRNALRSNPTPFPADDLEARLDQFVEESLVLIPAAFQAFGKADLIALGEVVDRSQKGAERGLKNQIPETLELARLARSLGAFAASAFGAGFGGSVWTLVPRAEAARFGADWARAYREKFDHLATTFFSSVAGPPLIRL